MRQAGQVSLSFLSPVVVVMPCSGEKGAAGCKTRSRSTSLGFSGFLRLTQMQRKKSHPSIARKAPVPERLYD
jgi:hypothetical protein